MSLTQKRAQERAAYVEQKSIHYNLNLYLRKREKLDGFIEIQFRLKEMPKGGKIHLDFVGKVHKLLLNDQEGQFKNEDDFIEVDVSKLQAGASVNIGILYECNYRNDGSACHFFLDNQKPFLYTQFEAHDANGVFPCFDQPDLKAKLILSTIVDEDLTKVLSNQFATVAGDKFSAEAFKQKSHAKYRYQKLLAEFLQNKSGLLYFFPETKLLPTYLFCFIAGELERIEFQKPYITLRDKRKIPLAISCVNSRLNDLKRMKEFLFEITWKAFQFYEEYFGHDFPFEKYDQIWVPQFNSGAMENAGIVTFNDNQVWKVDPSEVTTTEKLQLANTITHQLSHHWFGNFVTMKWWDDLWLNESFADFISYYCLEKIKDKGLKTVQYDSAILAYLYRKEWGYRDDAVAATTHPIRGTVPDVGAADSIFDGITYAKGGASLRQLQFLVTEENFSKALSDYFNDERYQFGNATFDNFLQKMEKYFNEKQPKVCFKGWKKAWFSEPSFNVVEIDWDHLDISNETHLTIVQKPYSDKFPTLRPHKINLAFFKDDGTYDTLTVTLNADQQKTDLNFNNSQRYRAILPNAGDQSFVRVSIDKQSIKYFQRNLDIIDNTKIARAQVWQSLKYAVQDGKMKARDYLNNFVLKYLPLERAEMIVQNVLEADAYYAINAYTKLQRRPDLNRKMFYFVISQLASIDQKQINRIAVLRNNLAQYAYEDDTIGCLLRWRKGQFPPLQNYKINITEEWLAVTRAFSLPSLSKEQKQNLFEEVAKKQQNAHDTKIKRLTCDAILIEDIETFRKYYEVFKRDFTSEEDKKQFGREYSAQEKSALAAGWNHRVHLKFLVPEFKQKYFADMPQIGKKFQGEHLESFIYGLRPIDDDVETTFEKYQKIELPGGKLTKARRIVKIIAEGFQKKIITYKLND